MIKKINFLIILATLILIPFQLGFSYNDISDHKYSEAIQFITDRGIVEGYPDGSYKPGNMINRAELLKIIINAKYNDDLIDNCIAEHIQPDRDYVFFPDVPRNNWYAKYVCMGKEYRIVQGYSDGTFRPGSTVNFVEALKITYRGLGFAADEGSPWYKNYVDEASDNNLIPLDVTTFDQPFNRGQMADMITRSLKAQENKLDEYLKEKADYRVTYQTISEGVNVESDIAQMTAEEPDSITTANEIYDSEGRLTDYARSLAPDMLSLNLNSIPKIYPENYGNNYFQPGTYNIKVGDGLGKDDILIKFVEFANDGKMYFEVFKKEKDNHYYHYPTELSYLYKYHFLDLFSIPIEFVSNEYSTTKNELTYHSSCTIFFDYCYDKNNNHYAWGDREMCDWRCKFDANIGETKKTSDIYTSIYPEDYDELAIFGVKHLKKCYESTIDFVRYDIKRPRLSLKMRLGNDYNGMMTGHDEDVSSTRSNKQYNDYIKILNTLEDELSHQKCIDHLDVGHELVHVVTKEMLSENFGLNEGLAEFISFQNDHTKKYECSKEGWRYPNESSRLEKEFRDLSTQPDENNPPQGFYATGFCFWQDLVEEYGYPNFVKIMQGLYTKSRGIEDFYVLDVMEDVIGEDMDQEILDRYSLTREATYVELCKNCEMFK